MLKNVIFDYGNVLIDWSPWYLFLPHFGGDESKCRHFVENICSREWFTRIDRGESMDSCIAQLQSQYPEYAQDIALFRDRWFDMCHGEIPGMQQLIDSLKAQGVGVFGLSNWPAETFSRAREKFHVLGSIDRYVISSHVGLAKPDPAIYRLLMDRYGLEPSECVFVDDRTDNVNAAVSLGMHGILFEGSAEKLEKELFSF
ncbi:MAG: HAD family phosphatase [Bacteroidaceae bacterium]|nr:HAD family phosphatase [Bacteroidaceae bacterium]